MVRNFLRAFAGTVTALALVLPAPGSLADNSSILKGQLSMPVAKSMADSQAKVMMAGSLVAYGKANKDPHALLTAAKVLSDIGATVEDPMSKPGADGKKAAFDVLEILKQAKTDAKGNPALEKEIDAFATKVPQRWVCYYAWACNYYYCSYVYYC